jgi:Zn-dependent protease with chaperone function
MTLLCACATPRTQTVSVSDSALKEETATQTEWAARSIAEEQQRLARVYRKLATKAHRLCGDDLTPSTGAVYWSRSSNELSPAYERLYGIAEKPTVLFVLEESPASAAGLQARDVLTHLNDIVVPSMERFAEIYKTLGPDETMRARIIRNGAALSFEIKPEKACSYPAVLRSDQVPNAFADGARIVVTRGMMAFAKDDFELSLVLAHELAHNAMHHMDAKKQNMVGNLFAHVVGAIIPGAAAWTGISSSAEGFSYSQEFEAEADYVGSYILAAAGLSLGDATRFWRRMAASNPSNINPTSAGSHYSIPFRMLALQATAREIRDKIESGQPVEPTMKDGLATISPR